jgi:transcriptional regulator with XRE-family HTH domain
MPWRAETLKRLRKLRGLTQQDLADAVAAHRVTIAKLETGVLRPGVDLFEALAKALRVKVTDLLR